MALCTCLRKSDVLPCFKSVLWCPSSFNSNLLIQSKLCSCHWFNWNNIFFILWDLWLFPTVPWPVWIPPRQCTLLHRPTNKTMVLFHTSSWIFCHLFLHLIQGYHFSTFANSKKFIRILKKLRILFLYIFFLFGLYWFDSRLLMATTGFKHFELASICSTMNLENEDSLHFFRIFNLMKLQKSMMIFHKWKSVAQFSRFPEAVRILHILNNPQTSFLKCYTCLNACTHTDVQRATWLHSGVQHPNYKVVLQVCEGCDELH